MKRNDKIQQKIIELIALAEQENDSNTQIVLSALMGARGCGHDYFLAHGTQVIVREVLLPMANEQDQAMNN